VPPAAKAKEFNDDFSRWAKEQLENAGESEFGELLRNSPAFKQAVSDFQRYLRDGGFESDWRAPEWTKHFRISDWQVEGPGWANRLPAWSPPQLPRLHVRLPRLPRLGARLPSLSAPMPHVSGRGALALGETVLWVALFAGCGFIVWQLVRRSLGERAGNFQKLGPWPVAPNHVRTAAELIAAFEYLGRLRFGAQVRSWNHLEIAAKLSTLHPTQQQAARELAALYARARYAPPVEPLGPRALDTARSHLILLAGASA
jgi:hypothetical protein